DLIERIHKQWPDMRILVSSMHDESLFAERALRAGALGFVNKSEPTDVFIAALQAVSAGEKYLSDRMARRLRDQVRPVNPEPMLSPIQALSNRELEVFELIGRGQSTKQIAGKLGLSPKTVETYREHIKDKLNLANANELTCAAVQWVLEQCRLPAVEQNAGA
ncbi:MAG: response regulator transcription factor, partial [Planctomycetes bacterium]|nr:response regulator transcription factor [Planctomycetota bacterium]